MQVAVGDVAPDGDVEPMCPERRLIRCEQLLEQMYGRDGIEEMRAVKNAIDPEWKLAPGVLFAKECT